MKEKENNSIYPALVTTLGYILGGLFIFFTAVWIVEHI